MSGTSLRVGSTLGPYRIDAVMGFGGMADVYRATHLRLDTAVALKVIRRDRAHDEEFLRRFSPSNGSTPDSETHISFGPSKPARKTE